MECKVKINLSNYRKGLNKVFSHGVKLKGGTVPAIMERKLESILLDEII